jgi:ribosomal protein S18 acetylase RimI-like enzyme
MATDSGLIVNEVTREASGEGLWQLCQELIADGTTYVFLPDATREEVIDYWFPDPGSTFLATLDGEPVGCYLLRPNQPGRGSHVANASYFVSSKARGQGLGRKLAEHSMEQAELIGFKAMQFNLVIETNSGAIRLWESLGFQTIGVIPKAFDHAELGLVDARIMHREL